MLIKAKFLTNGGTFTRVINTNTVVYIDDKGVMFAPDVHALFAPGEYERILRLLERNKEVV